MPKGLVYEFLDSDVVKNISIRGIMSIGCSRFNEYEYYKSKGINNIILFEANPNLASHINQAIQENSRIKLFNEAVCDYVGTTKFYITNNEESSSILKLKKHSEICPEIINTETIEVPCTTIDHALLTNNINPYDYNALAIDVQGAELLCFRGASEYLKTCDVICTEVNFSELYEGCGLIHDIDAELSKYGFVRRFTGNMWGIGNMSGVIEPEWGDAVYTKD
jgi:FkbM family methyltransferase